MNWSHGLSLFLMLAFLVAVFTIFVWFAIRLLSVSRRERGAITQALEKSRELLATGKITTQEFETIKRGLENSQRIGVDGPTELRSAAEVSEFKGVGQDEQRHFESQAPHGLDLTPAYSGRMWRVILIPVK